LENTVVDFSKTTEAQLDSATQQFNVFAGSLAANAAIAGFQALKNAAVGLFNTFIIDGVKAAQVQEDAINELNAALKRNGEFSEETSQEIQDYASSLQQISTFGDEAILSQIAFAQSMGASAEQSKEIAAASIDLAAALGTDLNSATRNISKTLGGYAGELGEVIPELKDLTQEQLRNGEAIQLLADRYKGAAQAQIKTFSGALGQLSNTFGDLQETIGKTVTSNRFVIAAISGLQKAFLQIDTIIKNNEKTIQEFIENGLLALVDLIEPVGKGIIALSKVFVGLGVVWDGIIALSNVVLEGFTNVALGALRASKAVATFARQDTSGIDALIADVELLNETFAESKDEALKSATERIAANRRFEKVINSVTKTIADSAREEINLEREKTKVVVEEEKKKREAKAVNGGGEKELSEQEQIDAKLLKLKEDSAKKTVDLKAAEIAKLRELKEKERLREEEAAVIKDELDQERATLQLERQVEFLGEQEAIQAEAVARQLEREGKVAQAFIKRKDTEKKVLLEEKKQKDKAAKEDKERLNLRLSQAANFFGNLATLSESGNRTIAAIGKASAIAQATISGLQAVNVALASAPPPINFALAHAVGIAAGINVAKIAGVKFQDGGIIGGPVSDRDNTFISAAGGEAVLNRRQQTNLFNAIDQNQLGGGGISINIEAGVGGIQDSQVDALIDAINDRTEFGNSQLRGVS
jgi:hypothetical protein